jgi:hypothetical protein
MKVSLLERFEFNFTIGKLQPPVLRILRLLLPVNLVPANPNLTIVYGNRLFLSSRGWWRSAFLHFWHSDQRCIAI